MWLNIDFPTQTWTKFEWYCRKTLERVERMKIVEMIFLQQTIGNSFSGSELIPKDGLAHCFIFFIALFSKTKRMLLSEVMWFSTDLSGFNQNVYRTEPGSDILCLTNLDISWRWHGNEYIKDFFAFTTRKNIRRRNEICLKN